MSKVPMPMEAVKIGSLPESIAKYNARRQWLRQNLLPWFNVQIFNQEALHAPGPLVVLSAHQRLFDPPLLATMTERHLRAIYKTDGLMSYSWAPKYFAKGGAIPIDRNDRRQQIEVRKAGKWVLDQGGCMLIFPSGTRDPGPTISQFKAGSVTYLTEGVWYVCVGIAYQQAWRRQNRRTTIVCSDVYQAADLSGKMAEKAVVVQAQLQAMQTEAYGRL